jgi:CDP-6-deoxy-D-xylo-4-hexulose-3-dehydrase
MSKEEESRKKVYAQLRELYGERVSRGSGFTPGRDKVQYAGSVMGYEEAKNILDAVLDGWLGAGRWVAQFEGRLARFLSAKKALMVNSGSSANLIAVASLSSRLIAKKARLSPGDEVITPAATFPTTLNPLLQAGLRPVLVDVDLSTLNLIPEALEKACSPGTRALFLPHTLGNPNDMDAIMAFAQEHDLRLVEDACDALGSRYGGRYLGTFGDFGTFSFYPAHHITTGEGGALVTNDTDLHRIALSMRDWGRACVNPVCDPKTCGDGECPKSLRSGGKSAWGGIPDDYDKRYTFSSIGYNLKPIEMQGAMGVAQLERLPGFMEARKRNFRFLYEQVQPYERHFHLPESLPKSDPCWFALPLTIREGAKFTRRQVVGHFTRANIEVKLMFAGNIARQPAYEGVPMRVAGTLKNSDLVMRNTFFLGVYPGLTREKLEYMARVFREFMDRV